MYSKNQGIYSKSLGIYSKNLGMYSKNLRIYSKNLGLYSKNDQFRQPQWNDWCLKFQKSKIVILVIQSEFIKIQTKIVLLDPETYSIIIINLHHK